MNWHTIYLYGGVYVFYCMTALCVGAALSVRLRAPLLCAILGVTSAAFVSALLYPFGNNRYAIAVEGLVFGPFRWSDSRFSGNRPFVLVLNTVVPILLLLTVRFAVCAFDRTVRHHGTGERSDEDAAPHVKRAQFGIRALFLVTAVAAGAVAVALMCQSVVDTVMVLTFVALCAVAWIGMRCRFGIRGFLLMTTLVVGAVAFALKSQSTVNTVAALLSVGLTAVVWAGNLYLDSKRETPGRWFR